MLVQVHTSHTQKAGNAPEEYEDAYWPERACEHDARAFRCAVADGATETSFAAIWARLLVRAYCRGELAERRLPRTLSTLARAWRQGVGARPLPWYAEEKVRDGAFSSLLGLTLSTAESGDITWRAEAIGDSCFFQVRDDTLITAFPLAESAAFNSRPRLISTNPSRNGDLTDLVTRTYGEVRRGDSFFLMTDALAAWFLSENERGERPWQHVSWLNAPAVPAAPFGTPSEHLVTEPSRCRPSAQLVGVVAPLPEARVLVQSGMSSIASDAGGGGPFEALRTPNGAADHLTSEGHSSDERAGFIPWITHLRHQRLIRNDDVTLLAIHVK